MFAQLPSLNLYGIGSDIVAMERIAQTYERFGQRFVAKLLTPQERLLLPQSQWRQALYLAKRFAAKEALAKALGTGLGHLCRFHDCQILKKHTGQPYLILSERLLKRHPGCGKAHLSLSDEKDYALAFCVLEKA